jgi:hypothetical protein
VRKKKSLDARRAQQRRAGLQRLKALHARLVRLPNTFATYIGQPCRKGKWRKEVAVVALVAAKQPEELLQHHRRVPKSMSWGRARRTDVLHVNPTFVSQAGVLGPGDAVRAGRKTGTVGIALLHPLLGHCVTTAAHVFERAGADAQARVSRDGGFREVSARVRPITRMTDYALLRAPDVPCGNVFDDRRDIGPAFSPGEDDVAATLFVLLATGRRQQTVCRGIHASITTPSETLEDCILTDMVTLSGDSGACLIDQQDRIWGVLRGRLGTTFSVFAPVQYILDKEQATLL